VKRNGFTLIETIIVVVAVGLIMVSVIGISVSVFRTQNLTRSNNKAIQNGAFILDELRRNILNSGKDKIVCTTSSRSSSIEIINVYDGEKTTISCNQAQNKIASISATRVGETIFLSGTEVNVFGCSNFVGCTTLPSLDISSVNFKFGLNAETNGVGTSQIFDLDVAVRN